MDKWRVVSDAQFVSGDGRGGWWIDFGDGRANRVYQEAVAITMVEKHNAEVERLTRGMSPVRCALRDLYSWHINSLEGRTIPQKNGEPGDLLRKAKAALDATKSGRMVYPATSEGGKGKR
jgi:hypothetical protein